MTNLPKTAQYLAEVGDKLRQKLEQERNDFVVIPRDSLSLHKFITLTVEIMFVSWIPWLITCGHGINLVEGADLNINDLTSSM